MVHFISFLSTMTARVPDSNLEKKSKNNLIAPLFFKSPKNLSKQTMIGMKLQNLFRRKEKLTNHVTDAQAHQGHAVCWHCQHGHAAVRAWLAG